MDRATHATVTEVAERAWNHEDVQINCWHRVGEAGAPRDVIRLRAGSAAEMAALRAGIRAAREGGSSGVVYELPRGFPPPVRAGARLALGLGIVVALVGAVVAVVAPSPAVIGVVVAAGVVAGGAALLGFELDSGITIHGDGRLRREGWGGVREWDLRAYPRVTVARRLRPGPFDYS